MNKHSKPQPHLLDTERGGLPPWTYVSPELLEIEKDVLFRRSWQCVAHVSDIPNPGDYVAFDIVGERALVVRGKDGVVRAFHNVCRHRGSRVVAEDRGSCRSAIVCPFHGWSYNLDGTLRAVPQAKSFPRLDPKEHGLPELEHEIWQGFVFVRFLPGSQPSVKDWMAPFVGDIEPYRLSEVRPIRPLATDVIDANWKSVRDVDNEGYHVPMAHPALQDLYGGRYEDRSLAFGLSRSSGELNDGAGKLWSVKNYKKFLPADDRLPPDKQRKWLYYGLYPNFVLMLYPDSIGFYQEFPISVDKTIQRFAYYALPDNRREMKLARYLSGRIDRDTGREDVQLIVWSCEAAKSSGYKGAILSDHEFGVREYHNYLRKLIPVTSLSVPPAPGTMASVNESMLATIGPPNWQ
jgi:phenylpropionate dioxygenase-like ring-hydroxylating dioxygenase large terminal subunit